MSELERLIIYYWYKNRSVKHYGFNSISNKELNFVLNNLNAFEQPDMYSILEDKIILIEHFEFDASKRTRKGMQGKREEALLKKRILEAPVENEFYIDKGDYEISLANWHSNFEQTFDSHYSKISKYKENIQNHLKINDVQKIIVGFFIENQYSPIVYDNIKCGELYYFDTIQFFNKIISSQELDFVLFGSCYNGKPQIFYFDRNSFDIFKPQIDLTNTTIKLSPLNKNEFSMYGKFSE